jgi:hypothetical protein
MKLFRTAFWLGVVIYNLPSPASQPPSAESQPARCPEALARHSNTHRSCRAVAGIGAQRATSH